MTTLVPAGSPSVTLPAYAPALFTAPAVAIGDAVTMIRLHGAGTDLPFTFGQPFREGDIAPGDALKGRSVDGEIDLQMNVTATHEDGSIRHAIISGVIPALETSREVWLIRAKPKAAAVSVARSAAENYVATIVDAGKKYTARPGLPTGKTQDWLIGPVAREVIHNAPFLDDANTPHPMLTAQFAVRDYANNTKVDITVEHTKAYATNGFIYPVATATNSAPAPIPAQIDIRYDVTHTIDGVAVHDQDALTHFPCSRWKRTYWRNGEPNVHVQHFTPYLIETKMVPAFDQRVTVDNAYLNGLMAEIAGPNFVPMGRGRYLADMSAPGGRPEIALMPDTHAAYILSGDKRAYKAMLRCADQAGSWGTHRRDDLDRPLDVIHYPRATLLGNLGDSLNRATGKTEKLPQTTSSSMLLAADSSHMPGYAYVPYLLSGDFYYLEELKFWTHWAIYQTNPGYRDGARAVMTMGQVRGQAWTLRAIAECAAIVPDADPLKPAYSYWLGNTVNQYVTDFATPAGKHYSPLGATITENAVAYTVNGAARTGLAPWQDDFLKSAIGYAHDLTNLPALKTLAEWKAKFVIGRMTDPAMCWIDAASYNLRMRETGTSVPYTTFAEVYEGTFRGTARLTTGCNTPERLAHLNAIRALPSPALVANEMPGYGSMVTGFPANMQPALALAVDVFPDVATAKLAWQRFDGRANQPKYGTGPQFAIVPRMFTAPAVIPAPPPGPVEPPSDPLVIRPVEMLASEWKTVDARGVDWLRKVIGLVG